MSRQALLLAAIAAAVVVAILAVPSLVFWAIHALFAYSIPLTFKTWLACWVLVLLVSNPSGRSK